MSADGTDLQRGSNALQHRTEFRRLWIQRINAAARQNGTSYSKLVNGLNAAGVQVDRKILADMAVNDPEAFSKLVERAESARQAS